MSLVGWSSPRVLERDGDGVPRLDRLVERDGGSRRRRGPRAWAGRPRSPRPRTPCRPADRRGRRPASPGRPRRRGFHRRPSQRPAAEPPGASSPTGRARRPRRRRRPPRQPSPGRASAGIGTTVAVRGSVLAASRIRSRRSAKAPGRRRRRRARRQCHASWPPPRGIGRRYRGAAHTSSGPRGRGRRARTRRLGRGSRTGPCASFLFARPSPVVRSVQLQPGKPRPDR